MRCNPTERKKRRLSRAILPDQQRQRTQDGFLLRDEASDPLKRELDRHLLKIPLQPRQHFFHVDAAVLALQNPVSFVGKDHQLATAPSSAAEF